MPTIPVNTSTNDTILVPAPQPNQFIRVLGFDLTASSAVNISLKSGSTVIYGPTYATNVAGGGLVLNIDPNRDLDCAPGQPLKIGLSASATVGGSLTYVIKGT
jgi:hypothetical protein